MTGIWTNAMPFRSRNANDAFSGVKPWMAVKRMLHGASAPAQDLARYENLARIDRAAVADVRRSAAQLARLGAARG